MSVEEAQRITGSGKMQRELAAYIESVNGRDLYTMLDK